MIRTVEAIIEEDGSVRVLEQINLPKGRRALVTVLEEEAKSAHASESALLSEMALGKDWNRPEEDAAWAHLQWDR